MKCRSEMLIDIICKAESRITDLKGEIMRLEEDIKVARANLRQSREDGNETDL